jgi:hypothetical protein
MLVTEGDLMDIIRLYRLYSEFKLEILQYLHILPASFARLNHQQFMPPIFASWHAILPWLHPFVST